MAKLTPEDRVYLLEKLARLRRMLKGLKSLPKTDETRALIEETESTIADIAKTLGRHR